MDESENFRAAWPCWWRIPWHHPIKRYQMRKRELQLIADRLAESFRCTQERDHFGSCDGTSRRDCPVFIDYPPAAHRV